jgi:hypothetical protein
MTDRTPIIPVEQSRALFEFKRVWRDLMPQLRATKDSHERKAGRLCDIWSIPILSTPNGAAIYPWTRNAFIAGYMAATEAYQVDADTILAAQNVLTVLEDINHILQSRITK